MAEMNESPPLIIGPSDLIMLSDRARQSYEKQAEHWRNLPEAEPPTPWRRLGRIPAGDFQALGYIDASDYLLLVTLYGRELWHCPTLTRIAADDNDQVPSYSDLVRLRSPGIGQMSNRIVRLAGVHGGGLPNGTVDGWSLELVSISIGEQYLILVGPHGPGEDGEIYKLVNAWVVAPFGFSDTGLIFIINDGMGDIWVYGRDSIDTRAGA